MRISHCSFISKIILHALWRFRVLAPPPNPPSSLASLQQGSQIMVIFSLLMKEMTTPVDFSVFNRGEAPRPSKLLEMMVAGAAFQMHIVNVILFRRAFCFIFLYETTQK